ncbi:ion transporter [Marinihelvus fidelis]|uniref:Ion transporter n=1 Tax=Marinihelvus fidelis TaxID=2613842 RepID=A0A5N0TA26_9GAMM|nr:ion transporter [Marinihelvus fidelis]KAA9130977.1 ion transporter [Marinihelvus fidelis]
MSARQRVAELLEAHQPNDPWGRLVDYFLIGLILANVVAIILATVEPLAARYGGFFWSFEVFSIAVFTLEYLLRLWSCVDLPTREGQPPMTRLRWMLSPLGLIDLLAIAPFYVFYFIGADATHSMLMLRLFRGLRLLRLFKLTRYSPALNLMISVLRKEAGVLAAAASVLLFMLVLASWGIYVLEKDIQPEEFKDIPTAMWWAVITITTVGYGDVVPVSNGGRIFAGVVSLVGIGMMALPAAILASGFYREVHDRNATYRRAVEKALEAGRIKESDAEELEELRDKLGIDSEEAMNTLIEVRHVSGSGDRCPSCGRPFGEGESAQ